MKKVKIIGMTMLNEEQIKKLSRICDLEVYYDNVLERQTSQVIERIKDATIIGINTFTPINKEVLDACPQITHIISCASGTDHIDLVECKKRNVSVTWYPYYCTRIVAEKTFGFILIAMNQILKAVKNYEDNRWDYLSFRGRELFGKTLCILGYGNTGKFIENYAKAFGMRVLCINSKTSENEVLEILKQADVITITMSLNSSTYRYLNKEKLNYLKNDVVIVNTARGGIINEDDLAGFLSENKNAIAFLDVLQNEPPDENHPFRTLPNVIVTPHIAWNSVESDAYISNSFYSSIVSSINDSHS